MHDTSSHKPSYFDRLSKNWDNILALLLAVMAILFSYLVANKIFDNLAHLEDEQAFVWQAEVIARGKLTLPSPPYPSSYLYPFVVDYQGQRFGKYPLGWPVILGLGVRSGLRSLVNPILAGVSVWLTFLLGKRIFGKKTGLLAAGLTLFSPFFLTISGSLLSHPLGLVLSGAFTLTWLVAFSKDSSDLPPSPDSKRWLATITAGIFLGSLALTRPWTAVGIAIPFAIHGITILIRGESRQRWQVVAVGGVAIIVASLQLAWQWRATGDPFMNLYTLWWDYDRIGFGPGHGVREAGHTLEKAIKHATYSFKGGFPDLYGWGAFSLFFIPFGIVSVWQLFRNRKGVERGYREGSGDAFLGAILVGSLFPSLVFVHLAYWVGSYVLGPRYYYEGLYSLTIYSAAGIMFLGGWLSRMPGKNVESATVNQPPGLQSKDSSRISKPVLVAIANRLRRVIVILLVIGFVSYNLFNYLPQHLNSFQGLYGVSREHMEPFLTEEAQDYTPALVIVHPQKDWIEYGTLLELANPFLDSPFIFVISRGPEQDAKVAAQVPERNIIHYYPNRINSFRLEQKP